MTVVNEYSRRWFASFLETIPEDWTAKEVAGIVQRLPLPAFRRVLDVCCGTGRHAGPLSAAGYEVVGVDRDVRAIAQAARRVPTATFRVLDQRHLALLDDTFDAAMILWQSFGYFDAATNDQVLADIAGRLRPGGRLLLDLYHPGFVRANLGTQTAVRAPGCRSITNDVVAGRLISTLAYSDGALETMDFELFEPDDLVRRARRHGLALLEACSWWDGRRPPSAEDQRYQLVLDRTTG
ncbi:MAG TPA: class I SAM-dependent methyltransferase [Acidimicrobiales bacterium]|nr:class I SAM-dependent methyltransferase [Acidimicrobiales bacterium]